MRLALTADTTTEAHGRRGYDYWRAADPERPEASEATLAVSAEGRAVILAAVRVAARIPAPAVVDEEDSDACLTKKQRHECRTHRGQRRTQRSKR